MSLQQVRTKGHCFCSSHACRKLTKGPITQDEFLDDSNSHHRKQGQRRCHREPAIRRKICAPYFLTIPVPMPGTASNSASFFGEETAILCSARSLKILNAGTFLRLASPNRHTRNACSTRVCCSAPDADTTTPVFTDRVLAVAAGDPFDLLGLFVSLRLDAGRPASFMTKSTGVA